MPVTLPRAVNLKRALSLLGQAMGGAIDIGQMKWTYQNGVCLEAQHVSFTRAGNGVTRLCAEHLRFKISLLPLLAGKLVIKNLTLSQPDITVCLGGTDPAEPVKRRSAASPLSVELRQLHVNDGRLYLEDNATIPGQSVGFELHQIDVAINHMEPGSNAQLALSLAIAGNRSAAAGTLKGTGQWLEKGRHLDLRNARLEMETELADLDASLFEPYVTHTNPTAELSGPINASFRYFREARGEAEATGNVNLEALRYIDRDRWPQALPGTKCGLDAQLRFKSNYLAILVNSFTLGDIAIGGQLELHPDLVVKRGSLKGRIPMPALAPLIPWSSLTEGPQGLRSLAGAQGQIQIERLNLPAISLKKNLKPMELLQKVRARITLQDLALRSASAWLPDLSGLCGELRLRNNNLHSNNLIARAGPFQLPAVELQATSVFDSPVLRAALTGPLRLAATAREDITTTLTHYGVSTLSGNANVDIKAHYRSAEAQPLELRALVHLHELDLTTVTSESRITLQGSIDANISDNLTIKCNKLRGAVNESPMLIDGLLSASGWAPRAIDLLDLEVSCDQLELAPIAELLPLQKEQVLDGIVHTELALRYLRGAPGETALNGSWQVRELQYFDPEHDLEIDQGECHLLLKDNRITLHDAIFLLNGQTLMLQGEMHNVDKNALSLKLNSPQLNIDKLIRAGAHSRRPETPSTSPARRLIDAVEDYQINLDVDVERGSYQRRPFNHLVLEAVLTNGRVENHTLHLGIAGGKITSRGAVALSILDYWNFDLRFDIRAVHLERLLPWFIKENRGYRGPASCKGALRGHSGEGWLDSLRGNLQLKAGPGKMPRVGSLGDALHSTLALDRWKGQLTGTMSAHEAATVIPVEHLLLQAEAHEDTININNLVLNTPGAKTQWKGTLSVPELILAMDIKVSLLGELDAALGLMPVLGRTASNMSKLYVRLEGPLSNPTTTKTLHNSLDDFSGQPIKTLEKTVGKSLNSLRKFWP